jgi:hypothetical protein
MPAHIFGHMELPCCPSASVFTVRICHLQSRSHSLFAVRIAICCSYSHSLSPFAICYSVWTVRSRCLLFPMSWWTIRSCYYYSLFLLGFDVEHTFHYRNRLTTFTRGHHRLILRCVAYISHSVNADGRRPYVLPSPDHPRAHWNSWDAVMIRQVAGLRCHICKGFCQVSILDN